MTNLAVSALGWWCVVYIRANIRYATDSSCLGMQTFVTLRNAIHPQRFSSASSLIATHTVVNKAQPPHTSAMQQSEGRELNSPRGSWAQSLAKRQVELSKKTAIVKLHTTPYQFGTSEGCNTQVFMTSMHANYSKACFDTLHFMPWALSSSVLDIDNRTISPGKLGY